MIDRDPSVSDDDEITLGYLIAFFKSHAILIACCVLICGAFAGVASFLTPELFRSSVLLSPVSNSGAGSGNSLSSLAASQFGSLASLAGMGGSGDSRKNESIAVLQSDFLTARFIQENSLLSVLYSTDWDSQRAAWLVPHPPTIWKATQYFKKKVRAVTLDAKTGLVTLAISWSNSAEAAMWANGLVDMTNDYLRSKAIAESEKNIAFLNEQATKTNEVAVKQAIYKILESEINKGMLARSSKEFAFKILDPAVVPEKPYAPQKILWAALGCFGGLFLGVCIAIFRRRASQ